MDHDIQIFLLLLTLTLMNILFMWTLILSIVPSNKLLHTVKLRTVEEIIEKYVTNPQSNKNLTYNVVKL